MSGLWGCDLGSLRDDGHGASDMVVDDRYLAGGDVPGACCPKIDNVHYVTTRNVETDDGCRGRVFFEEEVFQVAL